ncbi:MAG: DUF3322 domain-containing protein, partial [Chloroflexota bacterium]
MEVLLIDTAGVRWQQRIEQTSKNAGILLNEFGMHLYGKFTNIQPRQRILTEIVANSQQVVPVTGMFNHCLRILLQPRFQLIQRCAYTRKTRQYGEQSIPKQLVFHTEYDLLRYVGKVREFEQFTADVSCICTSLDELEPWLQENPQTVIKHAGD